jgi:phospholipid/cholesterol/gamma-HCH transport system substrate-binding protein
VETTARHTLVGAFVLAILLAVFVMIIWLARIEPGKTSAFYDIYFFGSVTGLNEGAPVRFNGVQIGRVEEISLDPANIERIRVRIEVERPAVIKEGAVASLELQGITGYAYVQITGGSREEPALEKREGDKYPVIASTPSRIEKVFQNAPELLDRAVVIADRLADLLDDKNREAFSKTLQNIQSATEALGGQGEGFSGILVEASQTMQELRKAIAAVTELSGSLNGVVAAKDGPVEKLNAALASMTRLSDSLNSVVTGKDGSVEKLNAALSSVTRLSDSLNSFVAGKDGSVEKLNSAIASADTAMRKLADFSTKVDGMVAENRPAVREFSQRGLSELNSLIQEMRQMVGGIARLTAEIERDPARFFFGDRREGYRPR